ncbi:MAG: hypothetical protein ACXVAN_02830 [Polyangia bacterium]
MLGVGVQLDGERPLRFEAIALDQLGVLALDERLDVMEQHRLLAPGDAKAERRPVDEHVLFGDHVLEQLQQVVGAHVVAIALPRLLQRREALLILAEPQPVAADRRQRHPRLRLDLERLLFERVGLDVAVLLDAQLGDAVEELPGARIGREHPIALGLVAAHVVAQKGDGADDRARRDVLRIDRERAPRRRHRLGPRLVDDESLGAHVERGDVLGVDRQRRVDLALGARQIVLLHLDPRVERVRVGVLGQHLEPELQRLLGVAGVVLLEEERGPLEVGVRAVLAVGVGVDGVAEGVVGVLPAAEVARRLGDVEELLRLLLVDRARLEVVVEAIPHGAFELAPAGRAIDEPERQPRGERARISLYDRREDFLRVGIAPGAPQPLAVRGRVRPPEIRE